MSNANIVAKKTLKVAGVCVAVTGVVALSAVVASGAAVGAIVEGFKSAGNIVKKTVVESKESEKTNDTDMEFKNSEASIVEESTTAESKLVDVEKKEIAE